MSVVAWVSVALAVPIAPILLLSPLSDLLSVLKVARDRLAGRAGRGARHGAGASDTRRQRLLFVVPAYDEELLIGGCASALLRMSSARADHEALLLPDACTDGTVRVARSCGLAVLELGHADPLGKPRLLEAAVARGIHHGFDAIVVIDADSLVAPDFADALAMLPDLRGAVAQGHHAVANPADSWLTRLAALLNTARYDIQLPLRGRAGINAPLTGNGMCIGSDVVDRLGVRCETVKEDLELYVRYTLAGVPIRYAKAARVYAQEAMSLSQAGTQRHRWQSGKFVIARRFLGSLLTARCGLHQRIDALSEVTHQGPVLHTMVAMLLAAGLFTGGTAARVAAWVVLASVVPLVVTVVVSAAQQPQPLRLLGAASLLPFYAVWRLIPMMRSLVPRRRHSWIRTARHAPAAPPLDQARRPASRP